MLLPPCALRHSAAAALLLSAGRRSAMPPPPSISASTQSEDVVVVPSHCKCRKVHLDLSLPADPTAGPTARSCHCKSCRKYHTASCVSYIRVPRDQVSIRNGGDRIGKFSSSCSALGGAENEVERWHCEECSSKLASVPAKCDDDEGTTEEWWVNLGPLDDDAVPSSYAAQWKADLRLNENNLRASEACAWKDALPNYLPPSPSSPIKYWTGGCACGSCRYRIAISRPYQLQHCHCNLCRELHGGPCATWMPVRHSDFEWTSQSTLSLVRTTPFGSRHVCTRCRGILTIAYDAQPDLIWPCAGGFDDASLPSNVGEVGTFLTRVCHICCRHVPSWLDLPEDGMERLADAC